MEEDKKKLIDETVDNLKHLDIPSLNIVKSSAEVLKARDALDQDNEAAEVKEAG